MQLTKALTQSVLFFRLHFGDIERAFSPPAAIDHAANWSGDIMAYRWYAGQDMSYWIYLDQSNVVRRAEPGVEYHFDD